MKIKEFIAATNICFCEENRLNAFIASVESAPDFQPRAASNPADDKPDDFYEEWMEAVYPPRPVMQVNEPAGFAIIPVFGMISKGFSVFEQRYFGLCDVDYISAMVDLAAQNPNIKTVIFYFNSPGGYIIGVPELSEKIAALTAMTGKKTIGYADIISASAAYEMMAKCGTIHAAPSAIIGSIGTYCTYVDYSSMAEKAGIKVRVFASGTYKAMGVPGTSLTKEQADWIQSKIEKEAARFKAGVTAMRPAIAEETMQGQWLSGDEAVSSGLVDGLIPDLDTLLRTL